MAIDLKGMSRRELEALKQRVERALEKLAKADMKVALQEAEKAARKHGFSLAQLTNAKPPTKARRKRPASAPMYRHPDDANVTWTGHGRQPNWIKDGLAQGKDLSDFAINKPVTAKAKPVKPKASKPKKARTKPATAQAAPTVEGSAADTGASFSA